MLSKKQKLLVKEAIGDGKTYPKFTLDPMVNYEIDRIVYGHTLKWDQLDYKQAQIYRDEVLFCLRSR